MDLSLVQFPLPGDIMYYECGCGFTCTSWEERKEHLKKCGKPSEKAVPLKEDPLPEHLKMGLEKWWK